MTAFLGDFPSKTKFIGHELKVIRSSEINDTLRRQYGNKKLQYDFNAKQNTTHSDQDEHFSPPTTSTPTEYDKINTINNHSTKNGGKKHENGQNLFTPQHTNSFPSLLKG